MSHVKTKINTQVVVALCDNLIGNWDDYEHAALFKEFD